MSSVKKDLKSLIRGVNKEDYQDLHWEGSFDDYLALIGESPRVVRNAFQRLYDLIMSYGYKESSDGKETLRHYEFFSDPLGGGRDAVFGLTRPLMTLVSHLKSAAHGFGVERRVLLLHGPVGSSKSTIVRMVKKGLEHYSRTKEGALYTYSWRLDDGELVPCPMHQEPLLLLPDDVRENILRELNSGADIDYPIRVEGVLNPFCRYYYNKFMDSSGWSSAAW
jgi:serine protein kinase